MARIQDTIFEDFYRRLSETDGFTEAKIEQLRRTFGGSKKPKTADIIKALCEKPADDLHDTD